LRTPSLLPWQQFGITSTAVVNQLQRDYQIDTITQLLSFPINQMQHMLNTCYRKTSSNNNNTPAPILQTNMIQRIPLITSITARLRAITAKEGGEEAAEPVVEQQQQQQEQEWMGNSNSQEEALVVPMNTTCEVEIMLTSQRNNNNNNNNKRKGGEKDEVWWWAMLLASNGNDQELLSIRKFTLNHHNNNNNSNVTSVKLSFTSPLVATEGLVLQVQVLNDTFFGIEQSVILGQLVVS